MKFVPTKDMIEMADALFKAMALEQTVRPIVDKYQKEILVEGKWQVDPSHARMGQFVISDPEQSYLMSGSDFAVYHSRCQEARDKAGLAVDHPDKCPLLVAKHLVIQCENALMKAMAKVTGIDEDKAACLTLDQRKKFVELTLRLLAPFVQKPRREACIPA